MRIHQTLDDQREWEAGVAAEYLLNLEEALSGSVDSRFVAPPAPGFPAVSPGFVPSPATVVPYTDGLSQLPLVRQQALMRQMMLSSMTEALRLQYESFSTPADILRDVRTWDSDHLHAEVPQLLDKLRLAVMVSSERVGDFFLRVRGYCSDLRRAGEFVEQPYAMRVIINGVRHLRFDDLRKSYGIQLLNGKVLDFYSVMHAYHMYERLDMNLPTTDSRYPEWTKVPSPTPALASVEHKQGRTGNKGSGSAKRTVHMCTWGPCPSKKGHTEDRCWTKNPRLKISRSKDTPVTGFLTLPGTDQLTTRQLASLQSQIDSYALQK
jgi:hypothetical protein